MPLADVTLFVVPSFDVTLFVVPSFDVTLFPLPVVVGRLTVSDSITFLVVEKLTFEMRIVFFALESTVSSFPFPRP